MNRCYVLCVFFLILIFFVLLICFKYNYSKKRNKLSKVYHSIFGICLFVLLPFILFFNNMLICDIDGNVYFFNRDTWKNGIYVDAYGMKYKYDNDYFVCLENNNQHSVFNTYIDNNGSLVFDNTNSFKQIKEGVYLTENNKRVYNVTEAYWTIYGNLILPETNGFYLGNVYMRPWDIDTNVYEITDDIICAILFGPFLLNLFKSIKYANSKELDDFEADNTVKKHFKYIYSALQVLFISSSFSFFVSFVYVVFTTILGLLLVPLLNGVIYCVNNKLDFNELTISIIINKSCQQDNKKTRNDYLKLICIYYVCWLVYCFVKSLVY